jgi:hypothetical protein
MKHQIEINSPSVATVNQPTINQQISNQHPSGSNMLSPKPPFSVPSTPPARHPEMVATVNGHDKLTNSMECRNMIEKLKQEIQSHFMNFHAQRQYIHAIQTEISQKQQTEDVMKDFQLRTHDHYHKMQMHFQKLQQLNALSEEINLKLKKFEDSNTNTVGQSIPNGQPLTVPPPTPLHTIHNVNIEHGILTKSVNNSPASSPRRGKGNRSKGKRESSTSTQQTPNHLALLNNMLPTQMTSPPIQRYNQLNSNATSPSIKSPNSITLKNPFGQFPHVEAIKTLYKNHLKPSGVLPENPNTPTKPMKHVKTPDESFSSTLPTPQPTVSIVTTPTTQQQSLIGNTIAKTNDRESVELLQREKHVSIESNETNGKTEKINSQDTNGRVEHLMGEEVIDEHEITKKTSLIESPSKLPSNALENALESVNQLNMNGNDTTTNIKKQPLTNGICYNETERSNGSTLTNGDNSCKNSSQPNGIISSDERQNLNLEKMDCNDLIDSKKRKLNGSVDPIGGELTIEEKKAKLGLTDSVLKQPYTHENEQEVIVGRVCIEQKQNNKQSSTQCENGDLEKEPSITLITETNTTVQDELRPNDNIGKDSGVHIPPAKETGSSHSNARSPEKRDELNKRNKPSVSERTENTRRLSIDLNSTTSNSSYKRILLSTPPEMVIEGDQNFLRLHGVIKQNGVFPCRWDRCTK